MSSGDRTDFNPYLADKTGGKPPAASAGGNAPGPDLPYNSRQLAQFMAERSIPGEIIHCPEPTPTVQAAARVMRVAEEQIAKTVLFTVSGNPVAVIACGTRPIDQKRIAARFGVGRKQVKLAGPEMVLTVTGYPAGTVPPFGHRQKIQTLIDPRVIEQTQIFAGGGEEDALVRLNPAVILQATGGEVHVVAAGLPEEVDNSGLGR